MTSPGYRVRRATLDDIEQLTELWRAMHFRVEDLARRITEFQVAETDAGKLIGALGLRVTERQGCIHSEAFTDFAVADKLRAMLLDRVNAVATNHGLLRLWTSERAPFWSHSGFGKPDEEALEKLPKAWREPSTEWLTLKLRDDLAEVISADHEFRLFMESEKRRTERAFQQARILKFVATLIALAIFLIVVAGAFLLIRKNPQFLRR